MRRTLRADRAIGRVLATPANRYTCAACRTHTSNFSTSTSTRALIDTEKWRKRIWKDKPPGAADPYGGPSAAEKYASERTSGKNTEVTERTHDAQEDYDMSSYEPADHWAGLEEVGGRGIWWQNRVEPEFEGFAPATKMSDPYELTAALHRTVVEVFALRAADMPLSVLSNAGLGPDVTSEVQIVATEDGGRLQLPADMKLDAIMGSLASGVDETAAHENPTMSEEDVAADRSTVDVLHNESVPEKGLPADETATKGNPTESEADVAADRSEVDPLHPHEFQSMVESWDPIWLNVSVKDPEIKFAVMKRISQLTGYRLSDADINNSRTVSDILAHLATPPKPRKVIEQLAQKQALFEIPNVKVYGRKVSPIDKQREVGRWKLIEEELKARGLPVTGHE